MILKTDYVVEEIDSDIEGQKASIDTNSLGHIFSIVSSGFYSRKKDSIVREIASNCFDAHKEAEVNMPVIISIDRSLEDDTYSLIFRDFGNGMSPDTMNSVYNKLFNSTKRDNNDFIGGFGLGSKTPFTYTNSFYITTINEGFKYEYVYTKSSLVPDLISLHGWEEDVSEVVVTTPKSKKAVGYKTEEHSGTTITIPLENREDALEFITSIKKELGYFDEVFVKIHPSLGIYNNVYSIYKRNGLLYKTDSQYSNSFHIVLGQVCYPIDWKELNIREVALPLGIQFEIGELQVTPNRENIIYTDEAKILIKDKIFKAFKEVNTLIEEKYKEEETTDLIYYLDNRDKKITISFGNYNVYINKEYLEKPVKLVFTPLKHLPITIPNNPLFYYQSTHKLMDGKASPYNYENISLRYTNNYILKDIPISNRANIYINNYFSTRCFLIEKTKLSRFVYKEFCDILGLYTYKTPTRYELLDRDNTLDSHYHYDSKGNRKELILNKLSIIKEYIKVIDTYFKVSLYSSHIPTEEWWKEYTKKEKEETAAYKRKLNKEIVIRSENGYRSTVKLSSLASYKTVIYKISGERYSLYDLKQSLLNIKSLTFPYRYGRDTRYNFKMSKNLYNNSMFTFIEVARTNLPLLSDLNNVTHYLNVVNDNNLMKYYQLYKSYKLLNQLQSDSNLRYAHKVWKDINRNLDSIKDKFRDITEFKVLSTQIGEISPLPEYLEVYNKYKEVVKDFDSLEYLVHYTPKSLVRKFVKITIANKEHLKYLNSDLLSERKPLQAIKVVNLQQFLI